MQNMLVRATDVVFNEPIVVDVTNVCDVINVCDVVKLLSSFEQK